MSSINASKDRQLQEREIKLQERIHRENMEKFEKQFNFEKEKFEREFDLKKQGITK